MTPTPQHQLFRLCVAGTAEGREIAGAFERVEEMRTRTALRVLGRLSGLALFFASLALGQQMAPTDYQGVKETVLATIDLAEEIDSVQNRKQRVSHVGAAPGGHIALHSH